jgi:hypothetical protein
MQDFFVVVLDDRQRRGRVHGCLAQSVAQLATHDECALRVAFLFLLYVPLVCRRWWETVRTQKLVDKCSKQRLDLFNTRALVRLRMLNSAQLGSEETIEGSELVRGRHWDGGRGNGVVAAGSRPRAANSFVPVLGSRRPTRFRSGAVRMATDPEQLIELILSLRVSLLIATAQADGLTSFAVCV